MAERGSELELLAVADPAEILSKVSSNIHGFKRLLENPEMTIEETTQAVKTLNKMCEVTEDVEKVFQCLNEILTAESFFHKLVQTVDIYSHDPTPDVVLNTLMLVKNFLQKLPNQSMMRLIPVIAMAQEFIFKFERDSDQSELHNHIQTEFQTIEEIKNEVLETMRKDKTVTSSHKEEAPPEDFRTLSVIPTPKDVKSRTKPFIRKNVIKGEYKDVDDYLDIQFRLLREDLVAPLRNGVQLLMKKKERREKIQRQDLQDISVYEGVRLLEPVATSKGVMFRVYFKVSDFGRVNWETSKRLIFGSLLCLSRDNFKTMLFCSVADRNPTDIRNGIFFVKMEGDILFPNPDPDEVFTMVETSSYFEAYRYNLEGLQKTDESTLPMKKYLLGIETKDINHPSYLNLNSQYTIEKKKVKVLDLKTWPKVEDTIFEEAQYKALQSALTKEFAVIQGPPGTGKTFLGLEIMKVLLHEDNKRCWKENKDIRTVTERHVIRELEKQILIVCYTNHALDQFVEGILQFHKDRIIRIGGGSKTENEKLKNCYIQNYRRKCRRCGNVQESNLRAEIDQLQKTFNSRIEKMILTKNGIFYEEALRWIIDPLHYQSLRSRRSRRISAMEQWLIFDELERLTPRNQTPANHEEREDNSDEESELDAEMFADAMSNDRLIFGMDDSSEASNKFKEVYGKAFNLRDDIKARQSIILDKEELQKSQSKWMKSHGITREKCEILKKRFNETKKMNRWEVLQIQNVWKLNMDDRWRLYRYWIHDYCSQEIELTDIEKEYRMKISELNDLHREKDLEAMQTADIIAMTTTGAAKYLKVLRQLKPAIVIVEEAAEVLEAHIVTSLSEGCEHLILIGDHKQLKPKPTVYQLARQYHLDVSLFERMIKNGMHCDTLNIQHRMREEICALLVPYIYTDLTNHESVYKYPNVMGITKNMFFFNHEHLEDEKEGTSHSNIFEARFIVKLGLYFMLQGYSADQITILTTYLAQMFTIRQVVRQTFKKTHSMNKLKITAVDNYQGEENDIILLSLVRSNDEKKVGFLNISNRVCVALSRAKLGLYVVGNMAMLEAVSPLWEKIISDLKAKGSVVDALPLVCHNHPQNRIDARNPEDFAKTPEGGCMKSCDYRLPCGHVCHRKCHLTDSKHELNVCQKPCQRKCDLGHVCPKLCNEDCGKCFTKVPDREWPCGHVLTTYCYRRPGNFPCDVIVEKTLPCQHALVKKMECSQDVDTYPCMELTDLELVCDHVVSMKCYLAKRYRKRGKLGEVEIDENDHAIDQKTKDGKKSPENLLAVRTHEIQMSYNDEVKSRILEKYRCTESINVTLKCGHVITTNCGPVRDETLERFLETFQCEEMVDKELPCKHDVVKMKCCDDAELYECHEICGCELKCGHSINILCFLSRKMDCLKETGIEKPSFKEEIASFLCQEMLTVTFKCGHTLQEKCHLVNKSEFLSFHEKLKCKVMVDVKVKCGHIIKAHCNLVRQYNRHIRNSNCQGDCISDEDLNVEGKELNDQMPPTENKLLQRKIRYKRCFTGMHMEDFPCEELVFCILQCGHRVQMKCNIVNKWSFQGNAKCPVFVDLELDCGHFIKTSCNLSREYKKHKKTVDSWTQYEVFENERIKLARRYRFLDVDYHSGEGKMERIFCEEYMVVTLECGHIMQEKCNTVIKDENFEQNAICKAVVDLELDCGHSIKAKCNIAKSYKETDNDAYKLIYDKKCLELVKVNLNCGHHITEVCYITQAKDYILVAKCNEVVQLKHLCGHWIETTCWLGSCYIQENRRAEVQSWYKITGSDHLESLTCKKDFLVVQPCGHSFKVSCIELYKYFQSSSEYSTFAGCLWDIPTILRKKLDKRCPGSEAGKECLYKDRTHLHLAESEVDSFQRKLSHRCRGKIDFTLPCSHNKILECHQIKENDMTNDFLRMHGKDVAEQKSQLPEEYLDEEEYIYLKMRSLTKDSVIFCQKLVDIPLYCQNRITSVSCGEAQLYQLITNALQQEKEHLPLREAQFKAHLATEAFICLEREKNTLDCGHNRTLTCSELLVHKVLRQFLLVTEDMCNKLVTLYCPSGIKSHIWQVNCHQNTTAEKCPFDCGDVLICGHKCRQKCGECFYSGEHPPCREPCQRQLLCGHLCDRNCLELCPLVCQFCHTVPRLQHLIEDIEKVEAIQKRFKGHPMNIMVPCQKLGQFPNLTIDFKKPIDTYQAVIIGLVYVKDVCQQLYKNGKLNFKTNLKVTDKILCEKMKLATEFLQKLDKENWRKHVRYCIHMWVQLYSVLRNIVKLKGMLYWSENMIQSCKRSRAAMLQKDIDKEIHEVLQYGEEDTSHILDQLEFSPEVPEIVKILRCLSKAFRRRNLSIDVGLGGTTWFRCNQGHIFLDLEKGENLFICGICGPKMHSWKNKIRIDSKFSEEEIGKWKSQEINCQQNTPHYVYRKDNVLQNQQTDASPKKKQRRKNKKIKDLQWQNLRGNENQISASKHRQKWSEETSDNTKYNPHSLGGARPKEYDVSDFSQLTHEKDKHFPKLHSQDTFLGNKEVHKKNFEEEVPKEECNYWGHEDTFRSWGNIQERRLGERPREERPQDKGREVIRRAEDELGAWGQRGRRGFRQRGSGWSDGWGSQGRGFMGSRERGNEKYEGWDSQEREVRGSIERNEGWDSEGRGFRGGKRRGRKGRH